MSDFTESSSNYTSDSAYYKQASDAADRGDAECAKEICHDAVRQFEREGKERRASEIYHLLGMIAYRQRDFKDAESWYQKSLAIDMRTGDDQGAARTYNNLSAAANACREYDAAEEWLWKSIRIKERLADETGLAASYHQMGFVAQAREDFDAAEKWYLKSLDIEEKLNHEINVAKTYFNLYRIAEKKEDNESSGEWLQKALKALDRHGNVFATINLGREAVQQREYGDAHIVYLKALEIAKEHGDDESQSLSYLYLGHLECEMGDHESSKKHYIKSVEIDERIHETDRAARSCSILGDICLAKINGRRRDFRSAKKWFLKSVKLRQGASWRDLLAVYIHLWYYRLVSILPDVCGSPPLSDRIGTEKSRC